MSEEDLKLRIQSIHKNLLNTHLDQKGLRFWVHAVSNDQDKINEFTSTILASNEYKQLLFKQYREMYIELVGFDLNEEQFVSFYEKHKGIAVEPMLIKKSIFTLPTTIQKYTDLIRSTFTLRKCIDCSQTIIDYYLDRICSDDSFDLAVAIENEEHQPKDRGLDNSIQQLLDLMGVASVQDALEKMQKQERVVEKPVMQTDQIKLFEQVFERPMHVQEYFKYIDNNSTLTIEKLEELHQSSRSTYYRVHEIYSTFMSKDVSEYDFIKMYLYDYESPDFFDQLIDSIIESDTYASSMKTTLLKSYSDMYNEQLDTSDIQYIFNRVQAKKLPVTSELIQIELSELKLETDNIISNLFEKYTQVLERQPDIYEVDEMLQFYRSNMSIDSISTLNSHLEKRLVASMEFHDMIKQKIKTQFENEPLPSQVFSLLKKVLEKMNGATSLEECNSIIKALCV